MATRTSLKDEELVSNSWTFMSLLASGLIIFVAILSINFKIWVYMVAKIVYGLNFLHWEKQESRLEY